MDQVRQLSLPWIVRSSVLSCCRRMIHPTHDMLASTGKSDCVIIPLFRLLLEPVCAHISCSLSNNNLSLPNPPQNFIIRRDSSDEPMFLPSSSSDEDDVGDTDSESGSMTEQSIPYNSSFSELDSDQKLPATTYATTNTAGLKGMGEEDVFDDEHDSYSDESDAIEEPKPSRTSRLFRLAATVGIGVLSAFTFLTTAKKDDGTDEVDAAGQLINRQGQDVHVAGYHAPPSNNVDTVAGYIPPQPHQADVAAYVPPPPDGKVSGQATASAKAAQ